MVSRLVVGGGTRTACILAANLERDRFRSILIGGKADACEREDLELVRRLGLHPVYIDSMRRRITPVDYAALRKVQKLIESNGIDVLHTHSSKAGALGRIAAVLRLLKSGQRPRTIHTVHGHVFNGYFNRIVSRAFVTIERVLAHFTDTILTVSNEVRHDLVDVYGIAPSSKVKVMPLGIDFGWTEQVDRSRGWLRERFDIAGSTFLVGTVGRLAPVKNHSLLLRSFQRARATGDFDAALVIFGDGELRSQLEKESTELGIAGRVFFAGWELNTARLFSDLDLTCLSSVNEGLPLVLLESIAARVPVVATRVGGVGDLVEDGIHGQLVDSGDTEAFAKALLRAASRRDRVGASKASEVRSRYSIQSLITSVSDTYEEALTHLRPSWRVAETPGWNPNSCSHPNRRWS